GCVRSVRGGDVCRRLRIERLLDRDVRQALGPDALRFGRGQVGPDLERGLFLGLDRLRVVGVVQRELLVRGEAAVPRAGQGLVRTPLAVGEDGRAAAGELLALAAAVGR